MSKFSTHNDFCDFLEDYGNFDKFLQDTEGVIYCGKEMVKFSKIVDIAKYYPHKILNSWILDDRLIIKLSSKSCVDSMVSEASKEYYKWKLDEEIKRLNGTNE